MQFEKIWQQALEFWKKQSAARRAAMVIAAALVLGGSAFFALYEPPIDFTTVASNLSEAEAAAVVEQIEADKVPYRLDNRDGMVRVQVPTAQADKVRLAIAASGLESGRFGFSDYISAPYTVSAKRERKLHTIALSGELARIIGTLDGVQTADVTLTIPDESLFRAATHEPRASVVVQLGPGRELSPAKIRGVVNLIAGSVQGLAMSSVTLVDGKGNQLWGGGDGAMLGTLQSDKERDVREKVEKLLTKVMGPGDFHVTVTAAYERSLRTQESETYETSEASIISQQTSEETRGAQVVRFGVAGARGNQAGAQPAAQPPTVEGPRRRTETINKTPNRTFTRVEETTPRLVGVAVSVLINEAPAEVTDTSSVATASGATYLAASEVELGPARRAPDVVELSELIKVAAGLDLGAGKDQLTVKTVPMWTPPAPEAEAPVAPVVPWYLQLPMWAYGAAAGAVVLMIIIAGVLIRRRNRAKAEGEAELLDAPTRADELAAVLDGAEYEPEPTLAELRTKVHELVNEDAELAAEILSAWIKDGVEDAEDLEEAA